MKYVYTVTLQEITEADSLEEAKDEFAHRGCNVDIGTITTEI